jgi:hypothetical protein
VHQVGDKNKFNVYNMCHIYLFRRRNKCKWKPKGRGLGIDGMQIRNRILKKQTVKADQGSNRAQVKTVMN